MQASSDHRDFEKTAAAFSLVEVILALGLASFALIALVGLLSVAFRSNQDTAEETRAISILETMVADRMASAKGSNSTIYGIPPLTTANASTLYVKDDGSLSPSATEARFRVDIRSQPATGQGRPGYMHFLASWPAGTNPGAGSRIEILSSFPDE